MAVVSATYRIQVTPDFPLARVAEVVPYIADLGVSHLYLSPIFAAAAGSSHGYDVVDMNAISEELGGRPALDALARTAAARGLHLLLDVVPNHRAFNGDNQELVDILEMGPHSRFYNYFDVMWDHPYHNIRGRILAPFLGDFYARCLQRGELQLSYSEAGFRVSYFDVALPIRIKSYSRILAHNVEGLAGRAPQADLPKLLALIQFIENLEDEIAHQPRFDYPAFVKEVLWELYTSDEALREHVDANIVELNGGGEGLGRFDLLDALLDEQLFRLSYWKVGTEELNYRRFFSVNDLICLRLEEPEVLVHSHRLLFELIEAGVVDAIRIDHVDGLYDPGAYLEAIRARFPELYVVVEKILEEDEQLPEWPVQGTTGYEAMDRIGGVLCDRRAVDGLDRIYRAFTRHREPYHRLVQHNKRNIVNRHMAGDIDNLALLLKGITNRSREGNDLTMYAVRRALVELLTLFPIYRTYVSSDSFTIEERDIFAQVIEAAVREAHRFRNELELIGSSIERVFRADLSAADSAEWIHFIMRLQQYTGPLMAKGVEDTTFYQYNRLISRNEVGSDPRVLGLSLDEYHGFNRRRLAEWPRAMTATATHDTKRGEDTRARISAIAEDTEEWKVQVQLWHRLNRRHKRRVERVECPTGNDEYLLYQTILGAAPFDGLDADDFPARLKDYMIKATREAKRETSWLNPNSAYEEALLAFIDRILSRETGGEFLEAFSPYLEQIAFRGVCSSLSQTLLKLTSPGVPDVYQGTELWDLSLVDPDNRRPVDYERRLSMLHAAVDRGTAEPEALVRELARTPQDGRLKLLLLHRGLEVRRERPELFLEGSYDPLIAAGPRARHVVSFARTRGDDVAVAVALRFTAQLDREHDLGAPGRALAETELRLPWSQSGRWRNRLTGEELAAPDSLPVAQLTQLLPVALLTNWSC